MLDVLPPEIIIFIIAYLPVDSLRKIPLLCRQWRLFFLENQELLYHNAALLHGYSPSSEVTLKDAAEAFSKRTLGDSNSWKTLCRRRHYIEKSWAGEAPTSTTVHSNVGGFVHRIKVDEKEGLLITTSGNGGLTVSSLTENKVVWGQSHSLVIRRFAHLEYTQGFIVFDRLDGPKEVWRRAKDFPTFSLDTIDTFDPTAVAKEHVVPESHPKELQINTGHIAAAAAALPTFANLSNDSPSAADDWRTSMHLRQFRPWAFLQVPGGDHGRAYRLADNFILGVSSITKVYLWDVRTGALVQTIQDIQRTAKSEMFPDSEGIPQPAPSGFIGDITVDWLEEDDTLGEINYIELNDEFVFLCGETSLRVFDRASGGKCVMHLLPGGMVGKGWFTIGESSRGFDGFGGESATDPLIGQDLSYYEVKPGQPGHGLYDDSFSAVHVSPCGKHLAIMTSNSRLILMPYFKRCLSNTQSRIPTHEVAVEIVLGDTVWDNVIVQDAFLYLAFNGDHVGVATANGVYVVRPNWDGLSRPDLAAYMLCAGLQWEDLSRNTLSVLRVPQLSDIEEPNIVSCLQLTETGLFIVWDTDHLPVDATNLETLEHSHKTVVSIDFWDKEEKEDQADSM